MDGWFYVATQFVAAAASGALAIALLAIRFASRIHRAFAVVLLLQGLAILSLALYHIGLETGDARMRAFWTTIGDHAGLALAPALAYFLLSYRPPARAAVARIAAVGLIVAALALQIAYMARPCLVECGPDALVVMGPLAPLALGIPFAQGLVGWHLIHSARRDPTGSCESAAFLVGSAFTLGALLDGGMNAARVLYNGSASLTGLEPWTQVVIWVRLAAVPVAFAALADAALTARLHPAAGHRTRLLGLFCLVAIATPFACVFLLPPENPLPRGTTFIYGLWRMALPASVVYALVRHRLFDMDTYLKRGLARGSILGIFVVLYVSVSKILENYLSALGVQVGGATWGLAIAGTLAGVAILALSPVERLGRRVAHGLMPNVQPMRDIPEPQRAELFANQARLVWADGVMGRKERALLDDLRDQLGLDFEVAARLEREAAMASPPRRRVASAA